MYDCNFAAKGAEYQEAERLRYRAECLARTLEASLDRITPEEFDSVMIRLYEAQNELYEAGRQCIRLRVAEAAKLADRGGPQG